MKYLLDTHTWLWWCLTPDRLSKKALVAIRDVKRSEELLISAISVWEFFKLLSKSRIAISTEPMIFVREALNIKNLRLVELTPQIAYESTILPDKFHKDPADQIIVATARLEGAVILTRDNIMHKYEHVRTLW